MESIWKKMTLKDLIEIIYYLFGVAALVLMVIPLSRWFYLRVTEVETYYSHCPLVLVLCLVMVGKLVYQYYKEKKILPRFGQYMEGRRLVFVILSCLVYLIGGWLKVYFIMGLGLVFMFYSVVWATIDEELFKRVRFWLGFMVFSVPLPMVISEQIAVKLKLISARLAGVLLTKIGIPTVVVGNVLRTSRSQLEVGAPCSGVRSLLTMIVLSFLFGYVRGVGFLGTVVLFLFAPLVAFVGNVFRIFTLGFVADIYGVDVALGRFHDILGYVVFGLDIALMFLILKLIEKVISWKRLREIK